jgi:hypothetical protein
MFSYSNLIATYYNCNRTDRIKRAIKLKSLRERCFSVSSKKQGGGTPLQCSCRPAKVSNECYTPHG